MRVARFKSDYVAQIPTYGHVCVHGTYFTLFAEFLLGEKIISAPVIELGAVKRHVYLPAGQWQDGNTPATVYVGPRWLMDYPAPLETLPYFIRVETTTT